MTDWKVVRLEEIATVERGKFSARPRNDPKYYGGNIPFLQTGDVASATGVILTHSQTLNDEGLKVSKLFPAGTLLITIAANIGDVAEVGFDFACPDSLVAVRPKNGVNKDWLKYFLQTQKSHFVSRATQNAQANINLQIVRPLKVCLPHLSEQTAIADLLSTWDSAIEKTEKLIAEKLEQRKELMQQLLSGKQRFPGFNKPWQEARMGDIFERVTRKNTAGIDRVLTASGEHGLIDQKDYFNRTVSGESLHGYYHIEQGEFAYNRSAMQGYPYGAIKRLDGYSKGVLSTLYLCFMLSSTDECSDFFMHYFESGQLNRQLRKTVQVGARAHGLLNVIAGDFFNLKLEIPEKDEQKRIASFLNISGSEISLLYRQLDAFKRQKKGLMQQLLTGKVRIKVNCGESA